MTRPQSLTLPAALIACLLLAWIATIAASNLPASVIAMTSEAVPLGRRKLPSSQKGIIIHPRQGTIPGILEPVH
jgi:hypothetical protein